MTSLWRQDPPTKRRTEPAHLPGVACPWPEHCRQLERTGALWSVLRSRWEHSALERCHTLHGTAFHAQWGTPQLSCLRQKLSQPDALYPQAWTCAPQSLRWTRPEPHPVALNYLKPTYHCWLPSPELPLWPLEHRVGYKLHHQQNSDILNFVSENSPPFLTSKAPGFSHSHSFQVPSAQSVHFSPTAPAPGASSPFPSTPSLRPPEAQVHIRHQASPLLNFLRVTCPHSMNMLPPGLWLVPPALSQLLHLACQ